MSCGVQAGQPAATSARFGSVNGYLTGIIAAMPQPHEIGTYVRAFHVHVLTGSLRRILTVIGMGVTVAIAGPDVTSSAAVHVPAPTLRVTRSPAHPTTLTIVWNTGSGVPGHVTEGFRTPGPLAGPVVERISSGSLVVGWGNNGQTTLTNINPADTYIFRLSTIGLHDRLLAQATVTRGFTKTRIVARSWIPPQAPRFVNRILQFIPFVVGLLVLWSIVTYARSLRGS